MHPRVFQYVGIILMCALFGGGYWYWQNTQAAGIMTDSRPDFEAPLMTSLDLQEGTGIATYSRADGADRRATVTDFEGLIRPVKNGEARFEGARRVENLIAYSEAFNHATWSKVSITVTSDSVMAPDGSTTADLLTTGGAAGQRVTQGSVIVSATSVAYNVWIRGGTAPTARLLIYDSTAATTRAFVDVTPTTAWQRFSLSATNLVPGNTHTFYLYIDEVNAYGAGGTAYAWGAQAEIIQGQANQNPSEYVSTNVKTAFPYHGAGVDGVKYFATRNGNTVASNVVTEATGAAIPSATLKGYLAEGSRTNLLVYSEQFDQWTQNGTVVTATNATVGPDGLTTAETLTDDDGTNYEYVAKSLTVANDSSAYVLSIYLKKDVTTPAIFAVNYGLSGGTAVASNIRVNSGTGASLSSGVVTSFNTNWWKVTHTLTNNSTGNTSLSVSIYPAARLVAGGGDTGTATGSSTIWGAQIENASFASSYIPTTSASVTRAGDILTYPTAGNIKVLSDYSFFLESQLKGSASGTHQTGLASNITAAPLVRFVGISNDLQFYSDSGPAGAATISNASLSMAAKQASVIRYAGWKNAINAKVFAGGFSNQYVLNAQTAEISTLYIGSTSGGNSAFATIRNVRLWKRALSDTQLTKMTSATDAISISAVQQSTNLAPNGTNLLGHWSFDEGSGTRAEDFSPNGTNAGTLVGSPAWADGRMDKAISFDGTDDYVNIGSSSSLNTTADYTISMWVYNAAGSDLYPTLLNRAAQVTNNGFFWIYTNGTNEADLNFQYADGTNLITNTFSGALGTNTWQHVMFTFDNTSKSLKLYINGNQFSTTRTLTGSLPVDDGTLYLGTYDGSATNYSFQGRLDDVRIYARALTSGEATDLYQSSAQTKVNVSQNSRMTNGLVGLWSFNGPDVSGTTAYDRSGQGNNGTLTGGPTPIIGKVGQGMSLNGINQYMLVSDPGSGVLDFGTGSFSVSVWGFHRDFTNPKSSFVFRKSSQCYLGAGRPGWDIGHSYSVNGIDVCLNDGTNYVRSAVVLDAGSRPTDFINKWIHIVIVFDRSIGRTKYYINGVKQVNEQDISTVTGSIDNTADLSVGTAYGWNVDGILDEVRIYNRALTTAEITDLYNQGR